MDDLSALDKDLNRMVVEGKAMDAFEKYYADDVIMQENADEPRRGKAACREAEVQFFGSVEEVHRIELIHSAVGDGVSFSQWDVEFTFKGGGGRKQWSQVARRRWKNGKVIDERFYYKP